MCFVCHRVAVGQSSSLFEHRVAVGVCLFVHCVAVGLCAVFEHQVSLLPCVVCLSHVTHTLVHVF